MNHIKSFQNKTFTDPKSFETELTALMNFHWKEIKHNDDLYHAKDISSIMATQKALLKEVIAIHQKEKNLGLGAESIINDHLQARQLRHQLQASLSCHDIYYLDQDCDYYFVGDLHSDAFILPRLLKACDFYQKLIKGEDFKIVFMGDYVDRGKNHIKILESLMMLKYLYPEQIYLLMGNHDIGKIEDDTVTLYLRKVEEDMDYFYIYLHELHKKFPSVDHEVVELYQEMLNHLNVAAFIMTDKGTLKAVHGGIPRPDLEGGFDYLTAFRQMTDGTKDHHNHTVKDALLWSDPSIQDNKPTIERKRFKFYQDQLDTYLEHLGIDVVIRGHQAVESGCLPLFDEKIYTVFSSGMILDKDENINGDTAYDFIQPKVLHYKHSSGFPLNVIPIL